MASATKMPYGKPLWQTLVSLLTLLLHEVCLGKLGLKVSKIVLGCMSYGTPKWQLWVLGEDEAIKHIKFAYKASINTFDTVNVSKLSQLPCNVLILWCKGVLKWTVQDHSGQHNQKAWAPTGWYCSNDKGLVSFILGYNFQWLSCFSLAVDAHSLLVQWTN